MLLCLILFACAAQCDILLDRTDITTLPPLISSHTLTPQNCYSFPSDFIPGVPVSIAIRCENNNLIPKLENSGCTNDIGPENANLHRPYWTVYSQGFTYYFQCAAPQPTPTATPTPVLITPAENWIQYFQCSEGTSVTGVYGFAINNESLTSCAQRVRIQHPDGRFVTSKPNTFPIKQLVRKKDLGHDDGAKITPTIAADTWIVTPGSEDLLTSLQTFSDGENDLPVSVYYGTNDSSVRMERTGSGNVRCRWGPLYSTATSPIKVYVDETQCLTSDLPIIPFSTTNCINPYYGCSSVCNYTCDNGYSSKEVIQSTCQQNGTWTTPVSKCYANDFKFAKVPSCTATKPLKIPGSTYCMKLLDSSTFKSSVYLNCTDPNNPYIGIDNTTTTCGKFIDVVAWKEVTNGQKCHSLMKTTFGFTCVPHPTFQQLTADLRITLLPKYTITTNFMGKKPKRSFHFFDHPFAYKYAQPSPKARIGTIIVDASTTVKITINPVLTTSLSLFAYRWPPGVYLFSTPIIIRSESGGATLSVNEKALTVPVGPGLAFSGILEFGKGQRIIQWRGMSVNPKTIEYTLALTA